MKTYSSNQKPVVILGVAESDSHVVANHLIAHHLRSNGYGVINLGACTPVEDFAKAAESYPDACAVLIGSLNGHALDDLKDLRAMKLSGRLRCPIIVGGNISVGAHKSHQETTDLLSLGVDYVLSSFDEILPLLNRLATPSNGYFLEAI